MKKVIAPFKSSPYPKFCSHPSQSFILKPSENLHFPISEEELSESVSIYENKSERESISNIENVETFIIPYHSKGDINEEDSVLFQNTYSFIQTYLSVLKQSKTITTYPSLLKFSLKVNVRDYTISEDNLFNYVKYNIDGFYGDKEFQVTRRYKEFISFRQLLVENWPGVFIPQIPPKKSFGNLDDSFINVRRKFLQQFFNKISASPHLASSLEIKIFLEPRLENFLDLPIEVYYRPVEDIYKIYSNYFNFLNEMTLTQKQKAQVQKFYFILGKTRSSLENLNYIVTEAKNVQMETGKLISNFYENNFMTENAYYDMLNLTNEQKKNLNKDILELGLTDAMYRTKYDNIYTTYFEWINSALIDTDAMIEAISTLYKYNQTFENKVEMLKKLNDELYSKANPSFLRSFFFQINLNTIENRINEVKKLKEEIEIYNKLLELIYKILFYIEIPTFKKDQYSFYQHFLLKCIDDEAHSRQKHKTLYKLIQMHCMTTLSVINQLKSQK